MNDHDWAHIDDGDPYDEVNNLPEIIGEDSDGLDVTPDFWAACSDDVVETDHDYVRDFPSVRPWMLFPDDDGASDFSPSPPIRRAIDRNSESFRLAIGQFVKSNPEMFGKKIIPGTVIEPLDPVVPEDTGTEIVKREPTKRVVIVYGRWPLPLPVARRGYTYETDLPLAVGDIVIVPPTAIRDSESEATVVQLGSDYTGWVAKIERMAEVLDTEDHAWYCTCRSCAEGGEGVEVR